MLFEPERKSIDLFEAISSQSVSASIVGYAFYCKIDLLNLLLILIS
jgi:hypothetical protein